MGKCVFIFAFAVCVIKWDISAHLFPSLWEFDSCPFGEWWRSKERIVSQQLLLHMRGAQLNQAGGMQGLCNVSCDNLADNELASAVAARAPGYCGLWPLALRQQNPRVPHILPGRVGHSHSPNARGVSVSATAHVESSPQSSWWSAAILQFNLQ